MMRLKLTVPVEGESCILRLAASLEDVSVFPFDFEVSTVHTTERAHTHTITHS